MIKKKKNYVNNKDLLESLIQYKALCKAALEAGKEKPRLPDYIGECILLIATNLNNAPNFYSYSYKEEMIGDGIENCIKYLDNFDPVKYKNPFAYITTICYNASIRRITTEKKQTLVKAELVKNSGILDNMASIVQAGDDTSYDNSYLTFLLEMTDQKKEDTSEKKTPNKPGRKTKEAKERFAAQLEQEALEAAQTAVKVEEEDLDSSIKEYFKEFEEE